MAWLPSLPQLYDFMSIATRAYSYSASALQSRSCVCLKCWLCVTCLHNKNHGFYMSHAVTTRLLSSPPGAISGPPPSSNKRAASQLGSSPDQRVTQIARLGGSRVSSSSSSSASLAAGRVAAESSSSSSSMRVSSLVGVKLKPGSSSSSSTSSPPVAIPAVAIMPVEIEIPADSSSAVNSTSASVAASPTFASSTASSSSQPVPASIQLRTTFSFAQKNSGPRMPSKGNANGSADGSYYINSMQMLTYQYKKHPAFEMAYRYFLSKEWEKAHAEALSALVNPIIISHLYDLALACQKAGELPQLETPIANIITTIESIKERKQVDTIEIKTILTELNKLIPLTPFCNSKEVGKDDYIASSLLECLRLDENYQHLQIALFENIYKYFSHIVNLLLKSNLHTKAFSLPEILGILELVSARFPFRSDCLNQMLLTRATTLIGQERYTEVVQFVQSIPPKFFTYGPDNLEPITIKLFEKNAFAEGMAVLKATLQQIGSGTFEYRNALVQRLLDQKLHQAARVVLGIKRGEFYQEIDASLLNLQEVSLQSYKKFLDLAELALNKPNSPRSIRIILRKNLTQENTKDNQVLILCRLVESYLNDPNILAKDKKERLKNCLKDHSNINKRNSIQFLKAIVGLYANRDVETNLRRSLAMLELSESKLRECKDPGNMVQIALERVLEQENAEQIIETLSPILVENSRHSSETRKMFLDIFVQASLQKAVIEQRSASSSAVS